MNAKELQELVDLYNAIKESDLSISEFMQYINNLNK